MIGSVFVGFGVPFATMIVGLGAGALGANLDAMCRTIQSGYEALRSLPVLDSILPVTNFVMEQVSSPALVVAGVALVAGIITKVVGVRRMSARDDGIAAMNNLASEMEKKETGAVKQ